MKKVAIIMGSDSDWPVVKGACGQLDAFGIPYEAHILSAHRTPAAAADFAKNARANGFGVLICAAGMAAHLAGAFAGNSTLPVIGIPMKVLPTSRWSVPMRVLGSSLPRTLAHQLCKSAVRVPPPIWPNR